MHWYPSNQHIFQRNLFHLILLNIFLNMLSPPDVKHCRLSESIYFFQSNLLSQSVIYLYILSLLSEFRDHCCESGILALLDENMWKTVKKMRFYQVLKTDYIWDFSTSITLIWWKGWKIENVNKILVSFTTLSQMPQVRWCKLVSLFWLSERIVVWET